MKGSTIDHYLQRYAEPEAASVIQWAQASFNNTHNNTPNIDPIISPPYQHCIVIPIYNESTECVERFLKSPLAQQRALLILIVNQPDNDTDIKQNQHFWKTLQTQLTKRSEGDTYSWLTYTGANLGIESRIESGIESEIENGINSDILMVNRFDPMVATAIPMNQGVGLARKIGSDIACQLINQGWLHNQWIHNTDADVHLPDNYFSALEQHIPPSPDTSTRASAAVYPYQHQCYGELSASQTQCLQATRYYERALDYYVKGLGYAGSPYAFHTLGSCIVTSAEAYCQARGFPKKSGGEDFYLLNKLAKLGAVTTITHCHLTIDARLSTRVPFGTGPAVEKIVAMQNPDTEYLYYHPECFDQLKQLLENFSVLFDEISKKKNSYSPKEPIIMEYENWLNLLSKELQSALIKLKIEKLFSHLEKQAKTQEQCLRHCHEWLDGFRTLKLIHLLETDFPKQALSESIKVSWY